MRLAVEFPFKRWEREKMDMVSIVCVTTSIRKMHHIVRGDLRLTGNFTACVLEGSWLSLTIPADHIHAYALIGQLLW